MTISHEAYTAFVKSGVFTHKGSETLSLAGLGLAGETGEVVDHVKKMLYHSNYEYDHSAVMKEMGDVLWYYTLLLDQFEMTMEEVMAENTLKLCDRHDRPVPEYMEDY